MCNLTLWKLAMLSSLVSKIREIDNLKKNVFKPFLTAILE